MATTRAERMRSVPAQRAKRRARQILARAYRAVLRSCASHDNMKRFASRSSLLAGAVLALDVACLRRPRRRAADPAPSAADLARRSSRPTPMLDRRERAGRSAARASGRAAGVSAAVARSVPLRRTRRAVAPKPARRAAAPVAAAPPAARAAASRRDRRRRRSTARSCARAVLAVGDDVQIVKVGDTIGDASSSASHRRRRRRARRIRRPARIVQTVASAEPRAISRRRSACIMCRSRWRAVAPSWCKPLHAQQSRGDFATSRSFPQSFPQIL